jgi:hypothetical protein
VQDDRVQLGHEQQLAVGVDEVAVAHGRVGGVEVDRHPGPGPDVAVAPDGEEAVDEVRRPVGRRERERVPAEPVRVRIEFVERRGF